MEEKKKKTLDDLYEHMFKQMEKLDDPNADFEKELKKTNAFVNIGNVIVNSAKAEIDFMKLTKSKGTGFIPEAKQISNGE